MPEQPNFVAPDLFDVSDGDLHIVYSTTGLDGRPHLSYQDPNQMLTFTGDEIRSVETDLGTVVSVTIRRTVDAGYRLSGRTSRVVTSIKTAHQLTLPTANLLLYIGPYGVPVYRATMRLYRPEQDVGWPFGTSGIGFSKGDRVDDNDVVISLPLV